MKFPLEIRFRTVILNTNQIRISLFFSFKIIFQQKNINKIYYNARLACSFTIVFIYCCCSSIIIICTPTCVIYVCVCACIIAQWEGIYLSVSNFIIISPIIFIAKKWLKLFPVELIYGRLEKNLMLLRMVLGGKLIIQWGDVDNDGG